MTPREKDILKILQSEFPVASEHPFRIVAGRLGCDEASLLREISALKKKGLIRRIGAVINATRLGYKGVLVAARVLEKNIAKAAAFVNAFPNVSHNYIRDAEYNLWFTFSAKTKKEANNFLLKLKKHKAIEDVMVLPSEKTVKINAEFNI